jgi:heavy metal sensor kinase
MLNGRISISLRLTMWFGGVFFLGWVLFGASMWAMLKSTLKSERRQTLARRIDRLQELLAKGQAEAPGDRYQDFSDFAHATGNGLAEVFRADGVRAYPSPSASALAFPWPAIDAKQEIFASVQYSGQWYWVSERPFLLAGQHLVLTAAAPEAGNLLVLRSFLNGLLASAPILLLISSAGGYWVSRRALRPVDKITATARSISIGNLSKRLPVARTSDELQRLAETCNAMLDRLESAVKQIKQFTADASHELRGPLSFTRIVAEVALRNPSIDPHSRRAFEDIVDEATKAAVLLEDMLTLARADAAPFNFVLEPLNLSALLKDVCEMARPVADRNGLVLTLSPSAGAATTVLGDTSSLRRLIWILLDNALKYTPALGTIDVSLKQVSGDAVLTVQDDGIGISQADMPHIFDRFYRADPSRGMVEGNGLGLAIAKWIAELHRVEVAVTSAEGKGTFFTLTFPVVEQEGITGYVKGEADDSEGEPSRQLLSLR